MYIYKYIYIYIHLDIHVYIHIDREIQIYNRYIIISDPQHTDCSNLAKAR